VGKAVSFFLCIPVVADKMGIILDINPPLITLRAEAKSVLMSRLTNVRV
jgi:hypothetical protein